ncbi:NAD-dependent epimerase/dehydratase family protein [Flavobacterium azooxidireducens]|uniref:NAD-dependent epimerase/dehydratase family protein n=1 Tax=Flavobacterium azooxidireducens TaxID=1871076 RepID=A0ABY4KBG1_9FLAO|nr:NAD-dependent epimerase/dehydratase family protein [Flavobacterium azooxidireducens]UPQ77666.1 NAD-dependent epimerase/dehydratase family protein [Flavobacterium azooxidireducens]
MNLVTGGTGLVGAHLLLHLLQNGEKVRALFRSENSIQKTKNLFKSLNYSNLFHKIEWVSGNVNDIPSLEKAFENIEFVYHCAALISFDGVEEENLRKINIEGTANMVNFALAFGVKKFCYVSSIAALGDLKESETVITEETEWNPEKPHSDYALSKFGAEMEIWRAEQEGLHCVIVNPGVILGAGFWDSGSGEIFMKVKKGIPFYTKGSSGFVAVEDVVSVMCQLMKSDISGERFTLIGENIVFKDLIFWIAEGINIKKPSMYAKPWMTSIVWRLDWFFSTLFFQKRRFSRATAKSLHTTVLYSNEKIKLQLNFEFQPIKEVVKKVSSAFLN